MMGIGAWLGLAGGTLALACTAIAGGLIAIVWAVSRGQCWRRSRDCRGPPSI
jgi:hypothetical protein